MLSLDLRKNINDIVFSWLGNTWEFPDEYEFLIYNYYGRWVVMKNQRGQADQ